MRQLYKSRQREGIGFSHNGLRAYERGEKPQWMWPKGTPLEPTVAHHIEIGTGRSCKRPMVMFYREKNKFSPG